MDLQTLQQKLTEAGTFVDAKTEELKAINREAEGGVAQFQKVKKEVLDHISNLHAEVHGGEIKTGDKDTTKEELEANNKAMADAFAAWNAKWSTFQTYLKMV